MGVLLIFLFWILVGKTPRGIASGGDVGHK